MMSSGLIATWIAVSCDLRHHRATLFGFSLESTNHQDMVYNFNTSININITYIINSHKHYKHQIRHMHAYVQSVSLSIYICISVSMYIYICISQYVYISQWMEPPPGGIGWVLFLRGLSRKSPAIDGTCGCAHMSTPVILSKN